MAINDQTSAKLNEWDKLLMEFESLANKKSEIIPQLEELLGEFDAKQGEWKEEQKVRADNFNVLRVMRLSRKELCHSNILAWLLDSQASHAQGNLGFLLFLKQFNLPEKYAQTNYRIIREQRGDNSQIDVVIEADGEFIIGIENKIDSQEGDNQTQREWQDLELRKKALSIPSEIIAFFLTPNAAKPVCASFTPISWQSIANIFVEFASEAKAEMVKMFSKHYADMIKREIALEIQENEL